MGEKLDWEAMMIAARDYAESSARHSERSLNGIAEILHCDSRRSSQTEEMRKMLDAMLVRLSKLAAAQEAQANALAALARNPSPVVPPLPYPLLVAVAALAALLGFAASSLSC